MEPINNTQSTIDDLLEMLLEKGIVLHTDMIISVANIPLIGISLQAAIAGMETMLQYGMMELLDQKTRKWALAHIRDRKLNLPRGEEIEEEMYGSYYTTEGIYQAWQSGKLYLTGNRLILYQDLPSKILFLTQFSNLKGARIVEVTKDVPGNREKKVLAFLLSDNTISLIYVHNPADLLELIKERMNKKGIRLIDDFKVGEDDDFRG